MVETNRKEWPKNGQKIEILIIKNTITEVNLLSAAEKSSKMKTE